MEEKDTIELTEKEIQDLLQRQNKINQHNIALGVLRRQYLNTETDLIEKIAQIENDYFGLLKFIFQTKTSDNMSDWKFDSLAFVFKKVKNG